MQTPFRIEPRLPAKAFKTYGIWSPVEDAHRWATCQEADCSNYLNGWIINVDTSTELGQKQTYLIESGDRSYTVYRGYQIDPNGTAQQAPSINAYMFEAGQSCFNRHSVRTQKPEVYTVRDGDFRDLGNTRRHAKPEDWVDDLQNNQSKLIELHEKG